MSYLEHLIENGLMAMEVNPDKWEEWMKQDENLPHTNLTLDELWEICQYIIYVWMPRFQEGQKSGKWIDDDRHNHKWQRCSVCSLGQFNWGLDEYCPHCGAKMEVQHELD